MTHTYSEMNRNTRDGYKNVFIRFTVNIVLSVLWFFSQNKVKNYILDNFFIPKSYPLFELEKKYLNKGVQYDVLVENQKIRCWKWGTGPAVIFSHGWNGRGIQFKKFFNQIQNAGLSVITFDGPGHGQSEGKTSSYFQMSNALRGVIKHQKAENIAAFVGHSFGAGAIINAMHKENLNKPAVLIAPALKLKEILDTAFAMYGIPDKIYRNLVNEYEKKYHYKLYEDNPANLLKNMQVNLLILHDQEDRVTPVSESREIVEINSGITLKTTKGLGHKRILTNEHVVSETLAFIKNHYDKL